MRKFVLILALSMAYFVSFSQIIQLVQIEAVNLEEDKGPFASMDDEIFLLQGSINLDKDSLTSWEYLPIISLSDSIPLANVSFSNPSSIDTSSQWLFMLIEMDTKLRPDSLSQLIQTVFLEYSGYPSTLLKEKIRLKMGDDDLLGFLYLGQKQVNKLGNEIRFRGMHMFNRYEYLIQLRIDN